MSAFGTLGLDAKEIIFDAFVTSSNKCLKGSSGLDSCIVNESKMVKIRCNVAGNYSRYRDKHGILIYGMSKIQI